MTIFDRFLMKIDQFWIKIDGSAKCRFWTKMIDFWSNSKMDHFWSKIIDFCPIFIENWWKMTIFHQKSSIFDDFWWKSTIFGPKMMDLRNRSKLVKLTIFWFWTEIQQKWPFLPIFGSKIDQIWNLNLRNFHIENSVIFKYFKYYNKLI